MTNTHTHTHTHTYIYIYISISFQVTASVRVRERSQPLASVRPALLAVFFLVRKKSAKEAKNQLAASSLRLTVSQSARLGIEPTVDLRPNMNSV
jgi:hypothetical protein